MLSVYMYSGFHTVSIQPTAICSDRNQRTNEHHRMMIAMNGKRVIHIHSSLFRIDKHYAVYTHII